MINAGYAGRDYRYTYAATGKPGWFLFDGLVKHDLKTGAEERFAFDDGVYGSETAMAPRVGSSGRGRRLPDHADHRHERRRVVLPGVRRRHGSPTDRCANSLCRNGSPVAPTPRGRRVSDLRRWQRHRHRGRCDRAVGGTAGPQRRRPHVGAARRRVDAAGRAAGDVGHDPVRRIPVATARFALGADGAAASLTTTGCSIVVPTRRIRRARST